MKFDMGAAWNEAMRLVSTNRQVVLIVAGVFFFLPSMSFTLMTADQTAALEAAAGAGNADVKAIVEAVVAYHRSIAWLALLVFIVQGIGILGLLALLQHPSRPTVGEALIIGVRLLLPYLAAQILIVLLLVLVIFVPVAIGAAGSIAGAIIAGVAAAVALIYLFTKFSLVAPVIVVDSMLNPLAALGRSWRLTKGNSLRLWLFYFLLIVAFIVIGAVVTIVVGLVLALAGPETALTGKALVDALVGAAWATIFLAALAAAHRQLSGHAPEAVSEAFE